MPGLSLTALFDVVLHRCLSGLDCGGNSLGLAFDMLMHAADFSIQFVDLGAEPLRLGPGGLLAIV